MSYLMDIGYAYSEDLPHIEQGFSTLIGEMGEFYSIDVKFSSKRTVHFHDSLKLLPFKVSKIAKDFGLPIRKLEIDYDNYDITQEKIDYISHDVQIVAMALKQVKEEGLVKMTTAGSAYYQYTSGLSQDSINRFFPILEDDFLDVWRNAYRGGRSQVNPYYASKILKNVSRYDINSMYPSIMHNEQLPYGKPIKLDKIGQCNFELYHIIVEFSLKDGHLPTLLRKTGMYAMDDSYYIDTIGAEHIFLSNIDYQLLLRHYNIYYIEFVEIYGFRTTNMMFIGYVNKWYARKSKDVGAKKVVDKLMLNSLYGKFGSNHKGSHKIPYTDIETGKVKYKLSEKEDMKKYYLPIAIAITSYAHLYIDNAIVATGFENFVYCDTDSVHTIGSLPKDMVDNKELGKFKLEGIEDMSKYIRQKTYVYKEKDEIKIVCAGMNDDMKDMVIEKYKEDIFKVFDKGFSATGKLLPKHVKGGVVLYETTFEIKV